MDKKIILKRPLLFLIGYCLYIAVEVTYRGESYRLMGIVGGIVMAFVCDPWNDHVSWDTPLLIQMMICSFIITILELLSGEFSLRILHIRMWDYSNMRGNCFDGLVCPVFSFVWFLLSGVGIVIDDAFNYYVLHEDIRPYYNGLTGRLLFKLPKRTCINPQKGGSVDNVHNHNEF